jgi:hypothetical protein
VIEIEDDDLSAQKALLKYVSELQGVINKQTTTIEAILKKAIE